MAAEIPQKIGQLIDETRDELRRLYASRLKSIILYGSYARGDQEEGSDVDLLLLLENLQDVMAERARFLPLVSRLSLKYDTVVSVLPMDVQVYKKGKTPLLLNVQREGYPL